jgi:hypothetical protein
MRPKARGILANRQGGASSPSFSGGKRRESHAAPEWSSATNLKFALVPSFPRRLTGFSMFSLQTIFGSGKQFYVLLDEAAQAAHESTVALYAMLKAPEQAHALDAFKLARRASAPPRTRSARRWWTAS